MPEMPQAERARRLVDALCVVAVVRDVRRPLVDDKVFVDVEEGWFKRALEERATATPRRDDSNRCMRDDAQMTIEKRARSTLIGGGCGAAVRHATTLARSTRVPSRDRSLHPFHRSTPPMDLHMNRTSSHVIGNY